MKYTGLMLILFWIINILFPDILAYVLGGVSILIWVWIILWGFRIGKKKKYEEPYVKFWNYKIYR